MRRLILLRHSKTERIALGQADFDRELTDRGRSDAEIIGTYIARHKLVPSHALVSPARRTRQTWDIASGHFKSGPHVVFEDRIYDASPERLFRLVETADPAATTLMIVGHNPGLHELALALTATGNIDAREELQEKFPTSALVVLDFAFKEWRDLHPQSGRLDRFVSPRTLADAN
ncbi:MAG: histidine phosphatase family protein [Pseudolabrys sp.]